jgi:hypothetical protein
LARWDSGAVLLDLAVAGPRACVAAGNQGVHIVGIGDPTRLSRLGGYEPGGFVFALDAAGDRVYVAWQTLEPGDPQPGVQVDIVEITDPAQPVRLGMIALPYDSVRDVQLVGDILYIDADALYAFNVSDPAHLVRTGMTILPPLITAIPVRLRIADERVYRLCHARFSCGVHLYQAPFTVAPYSEFTFWPTRGNAPDIWIQGRYLFVLDSPISFDSPQPPDRVTVLSTADPFHLGRVGQRELSPDAGEARFIRTLDDHVCVGTELGLVILKAAKQPAFLRSAQVQANRFQLVCNDAEGMRLQRSRSLVDPVWEDLGAVNPDQVVLVSMDGGQAFFRLVKPEEP